MGLLRRLATFPVSAPLGGVTWLAARIAEAADAERNDPAALRAALRDAEALLVAGDLTEEAYDTIEMDILTRLGACPT
jgi:hypothetical protein